MLAVPTDATLKSITRKKLITFKSFIYLEATQQTFNGSNSAIENTRKRCEVCSRLAIKTPERLH